ncbi:MAG: pilus assembly protein [Chloroflexi bacterium]|nr:pilus assembly protein [Chloroflexota bacterium]
MIRQTSRERRQPRTTGQALVEFSLVLLPFVVILMGIIDLGRGIYMSDGVTQAAREIARTTAVHLCALPASCVIGSSTETQATIATQKNLIPGLSSPTANVAIACTTVKDVVVTTPCGADSKVTHYIRVTVKVPFSVLTPVLSMVAPSTLQATAHIEVP